MGSKGVAAAKFDVGEAESMVHHVRIVKMNGPLPFPLEVKSVFVLALGKGAAQHVIFHAAYVTLLCFFYCGASKRRKKPLLYFVVL